MCFMHAGVYMKVQGVGTVWHAWADIFVASQLVYVKELYIYSLHPIKYMWRSGGCNTSRKFHSFSMPEIYSFTDGNS